jgi:OOP family OmpA-OmpF porin
VGTEKLFLAAAVALGASAFDVAAQTGSNEGYWGSAAAGATWKNPFGNCWRAGYWTPAMANSECDPDLAPKPAAAPAPAPRAAPPPPPPPAAKPAPKPLVITLKSTELFEFNKATLTSSARATLDREVIAKLKDIRDIRFINVNGHTDRLGSAQYNQKLSEKRADAVRAYLVSKGADASKIETYGFGKTLPIKACPDQKNRKALIECLAPNRRVEVEVQSGPQ